MVYIFRDNPDPKFPHTLYTLDYSVDILCEGEIEEGKKGKSRLR